MSQSYFQWARSEPGEGQQVQFSVYIPSCVPGGAPIANYTGAGVYLGSCADGFMTRATTCSLPDSVGQVIFTRDLWACDRLVA